MSSTYNAAHSSDKHVTSSFVLGLIMVIATFLILPLLSTIPNPFEKEKEVPVVTGTIDLPDHVIFEPPPATIDKQEIKKPILEDKLPPISLTMLEQLINPGDGGSNIAVGFKNMIGAMETEAGIFLPDELDKRPRALFPAKPLYPYSMRGTPGEVVVEFIIDASGKVKRPRIVKSSNWAFENPAIDAINKTKWQPGEKHGKAVQTLVSLTISFNN